MRKEKYTDTLAEIKKLLEDATPDQKRLIYSKLILLRESYTKNGKQSEPSTAIGDYLEEV
jgi:hypothetical protein